MMAAAQQLGAFVAGLRVDAVEPALLDPVSASSRC